MSPRHPGQLSSLLSTNFRWEVEGAGALAGRGSAGWREGVGIGRRQEVRQRRPPGYKMVSCLSVRKKLRNTGIQSIPKTQNDLGSLLQCQARPARQ